MTNPSSTDRSTHPVSTNETRRSVRGDPRAHWEQSSRDRLWTSSGSTTNRPPPSSTGSAVRPNDGENVTWLDFMRGSSGMIDVDDNNRSTLADRKRRHTGTEQERRDYPHTLRMSVRRPSGLSAGSASAAGSSLDDAIDLTSPPRQTTSHRAQVPQRSSGSNGSMRRGAEGGRGLVGEMRASFGGEVERRNSEVPPKWQPDAEVSQCPVCSTDFSFWYRKHHCRKCGRVVCGPCSPHRITIPRQYIVQPPTAEAEPSQTSPTAPSPSGRNLGGGQVVRVCNPCVPDPWTPDAAPEPATRPSNEPIRRRESREEVQRPDRYRPIPPPPSSRHPESPIRARSQSHQPQVPNLSRSVPQHRVGAPLQLPPLVPRSPHSRQPQQLPPPSSSSRPTAHRHSQSAHSSNAPHSSASPQFGVPSRPAIPLFAVPGRPSLPIPSAPQHPQSRPRREVREEDECPVCGIELPPGENVREAHIQECIALRFSSTPSNTAPFAPPTSTSASTPPGQTQQTPASRPRASSSYHRPRGMALYRATEKDCTTEDDLPQECVICFEEFQPGDEMGRMECLCKFHRVCIRQWWDTKGNGSCPTHMLHE